MNTKTKQELPKWFNGELYEEGATVRNRFSGEEYELNAMELSMYDFVIGSSIMSEMGMDAYGFAPDHKIVKNLRKGLDWFRKHNAEAYMVLLD
jgi:hypothetical protein